MSHLAAHGFVDLAKEHGVWFLVPGVLGTIATYLLVHNSSCTPGYKLPSNCLNFTNTSCGPATYTECQNALGFTSVAIEAAALEGLVAGIVLGLAAVLIKNLFFARHPS